MTKKTKNNQVKKEQPKNNNPTFDALTNMCKGMFVRAEAKNNLKKGK